MSINFEQLKVGIEDALKGGSGSGNFGHSGRPGEIGGSADESGVDLHFILGELSDDARNTVEDYAQGRISAEGLIETSLDEEDFQIRLHEDLEEAYPTGFVPIYRGGSGSVGDGYSNGTLSRSIAHDYGSGFTGFNVGEIYHFKVPIEDVVAIGNADEQELFFRVANASETVEHLKLKSAIELALKGGAGSGNFGHSGRPGEQGGSTSDPSSMNPREYADHLTSLTEDERDNIESSENFSGYVLYEAEKLAPKEGKIKKLSDSNSFVLWQEADAITTVDGNPYLLTKQEDPDDEENFPKVFVWSFSSPKNFSHFTETSTSDSEELVNAIRNYKPKLAAKPTGSSIINKAANSWKMPWEKSLKGGSGLGNFGHKGRAEQICPEDKDMTVKSFSDLQTAIETRADELKGGSGSGNFHHGGRPGQQGGSGASGHNMSETERIPDEQTVSTAESYGWVYKKTIRRTSQKVFEHPSTGYKLQLHIQGKTGSWSIDQGGLKVGSGKSFLTLNSFLQQNLDLEKVVFISKSRFDYADFVQKLNKRD